MAENSDFDPQRVLGGDLSECEPGQILELTKKLCRIAAAECGEQGFRGGFRPGNIYVAEDGTVAVGAAGKPGENGWTKLELEFMAPELFWNGEKSAAADVYSIALILYTGLNGGKLPFIDSQEMSDEQRAGALRRRLSGDGFEMPEGIDEALAAIVARALSFEPKKRYADAYEMLSALLEYSGEEPEPRPESRGAVTPKTEKPEEKEEKPQPEQKAPPKKEEPKKPEVKKPQAQKPQPEKPQPAAVEPVKEKLTIHERRSARRSVISLAAIFVLLLATAFARDAMTVKPHDPVAEVTPTPAVEQTAQPTVEPTVPPAPEPTPTPAQVQYMLYTEDLSRDAAEQKCVALGGHLATIKNADDYARICELLSGTSAQYVWIGAYRDSEGAIKWPDGGSYDYYAWAPGEPSLTDSYDGAAENFVMLVRQPDGSWLYNDSRENPLANYARFYSGKIAYICQIG